MGIFDNIRKKAAKAVDEHGDKIESGIDKAVAAANTKTRGKHSAQLDKGAAAAKKALDKLDGRDNDTPGTPPAPTH
jgi:hypothetical protein